MPAACDEVQHEEVLALVQRARSGDVGAFGELVRRHQSAVRRQLRRLTKGDTMLADDLAQDSFVQAWTGLAGFRGEARFSTWLYRIAYHRFLMHARSVRDELPLADEGLPALEAAAEEADLALHVDIDRAISRLPEAERVAIEHCFRLDLSHEEAAVVLGVPLGTLKSQVARGKARLRDWLAAWQTGVQA